MLALTILDIRPFMSAFLIGPLFDPFLLEEAQITTFCTYTIDGHLEKRFLGEEMEDNSTGNRTEGGRAEYTPWKIVKAHCFDMIRGKRTPLSFRFTFFLPRAQAEEMLTKSSLSFDPERIGGFALNLRFSGGSLTATTGVAYRSFTTDRSADEVWDGFVRAFFRKAGITVSEG